MEVPADELPDGPVVVDSAHAIESKGANGEG
jgi:hypothetical protein